MLLVGAPAGDAPSAFRCLKSVDVRVGPAHHRRGQRMRAQLLLCLLANYMEWHLLQALAELLFADEELAAWQADRDPVAAAKPRQPVQAKKSRHRTAGGLELQSFSTLLETLSALSSSMPSARR